MELVREDGQLRVLVVSPFGTSAVTGGAEKWLTQMLAQMPRMTTWRVLLLQRGPFRDELQAAGVDVSVHQTGASPYAVAKAVLHTVDLLRRWRPDVVVGNGVKAQVVVALAALPLGTPTVWVKHDYSFDRSLAWPLGWWADAVVATAREVGAAVGRPDLVVVNPPAQARRPSDRDTARVRLARLGLHLDDRPTLVVAGRLVPYKGVDDAIAALAHPAARGWRLVVIGEEDQSARGERERLVGLAGATGVSARVTFLSPVHGLPDLFAAFDALAVLTKPVGRRSPGREGFGMTAFEAMQAGVPVIAVDGSPVASRLGDAAGVTVPAGSPEQVALALGRLSDPTVRSTMGSVGRDLVRSHPGPEETARSFHTVLLDTARVAQAAQRGLWDAAVPGPFRTAIRRLRATTGPGR